MFCINALRYIAEICVSTSCLSDLPKCVSDFFKIILNDFYVKKTSEVVNLTRLIPLKLHYKKTKQDIENLRHTLKDHQNSLYSSKFERDISRYQDKTQGKPIYANYLSRDSYVNNGNILVTKMFPYIQAFRKHIIYGGSQLIKNMRTVRLKWVCFLSWNLKEIRAISVTG